MPTVIAIDPVTRLEGHLRVDLTVDAVGGKQQVVDAHATGTLFRGFEQMLVSRDPWDAPHLTQRVCGVCPIPHGLAAVLALDAAARKTVPNNGRLLRNLVLGANFIQSHLLHFYHLALMDFVGGPAMPPWTPDWAVDRRIGASDAARLVANYQAALKYTRQAHEMGAVFAGRMPHAPSFIPGGFTDIPTPAQITKFRDYCTALVGFIRGTYVPDVEFVTAQYPDYNQIGRGYANLLSFGVFELDAAGKKKFLPAGRAVNAGTTVQPVDTAKIAEHVTASWYDNTTTRLHPSGGATKPVHPKDGAYSWIKAPRYGAEACETGPLARMWAGGFYRKGISVNDRNRARAHEALKIAEGMLTWLGEVRVGQPVYSSYITPANASAAGLTEAPRGALGHWVRIAAGKIAHYQILTPTCWNASPRDDARNPGPLEKALVGTPVQDVAKPVEALRVIHSFDPCLSCAVHVARPAEAASVTVLRS